MKYIFPTLFCIPTCITFGVAFPLIFADRRDLLGEWGVVMVGLSFLACPSCIGMALVKPESNGWRAAAFITTIPWMVFIIVFVLFIAPGLA